MLGGRSWSVERDPRAGACSEFEELEGAARLRSRTVERGRGAGVAATKIGKLCRLLHNNLGQNKLSFGVFCSLELSQEPQPLEDPMRVKQEAEGRERGDGNDSRGGGCHRDAENASFGGWSCWDVKARGR